MCGLIRSCIRRRVAVVSGTVPLVLLLSILAGCGTGDSEPTGNVERDWPVLSGEKRLEKVGSIDTLGNPRELMARGDSVLYLVDWAMNGLHRYDWTSGTLSEGTGIGRGPGEVRDESAYVLAPMSDGRLWFHDRQQGRITVYDASLNPIDQITLSGSLRSLPLGDSLMATVPSGGEILTSIHDLREVSLPLEAGNPETAQWTYRVEDRERFDVTIRNFAVRYGPAAACGTEVVTGFDFASPLLRIHSDSAEVLSEPERIDFPTFPDLKTGQVRLPSWFNPKGTLDLACDGSHFYALFSGRQVSREEIPTLGNLSSSRRAELSARTERSDRLHVYDRSTGAFEHEILIPVEARRLTASDNHLYFLVHEDDGPRILRYTWTDSTHTAASQRKRGSTKPRQSGAGLLTP